MSVGENEILLAMKEAVRRAVCEAANEEIKKQIHHFECEMGKVKRDVVAKIVNQLQIETMHCPAQGEYVIQIRLNGGDKV